MQEGTVQYFLDHGWSVYPKDVGPDREVFMMADLLIVRGRRQAFVECLTGASLSKEKVEDKRQIERYAILMFVLEDEPREAFETAAKWQAHRRLLAWVARKNRTYLWSPSNQRIRPYTVR